MGTSDEVGDDLIGTTDIIQHEADWRQVLNLMNLVIQRHARPNHTNQTNVELPTQYKEE